MSGFLRVARSITGSGGRGGGGGVLRRCRRHHNHYTIREWWQKCHLRWLSDTTTATAAPKRQRRIRRSQQQQEEESSPLQPSQAAPTLESVYQRKTPIEHVLLRPDAYVGSMECHNDVTWHYDAKRQKIVSGKCAYVPAFIKTVDELLVNASDNWHRDATMSRIDVWMHDGDGDGDGCEISVLNDGRGLPIRIHKVEKMWIPELIMGHLLTGSNFDDSVGKVTGGRSGFGAKLTNIFSRRFVLETGDARRDLYYRQTWENNMTVCHEPVIKKLSDVVAATSEATAAAPGSSRRREVRMENFTRVSFVPDLRRFGMLGGGLDDDTRSMLTKRVIDVGGCTVPGVRVSLNGEPVPCQDFESMCHMYMHNDDADADATTTAAADGDGAKTSSSSSLMPPPSTLRVLEPRKRWQIGIARSSTGHFQHASFVNGISTARGGTHMGYVTDQMASVLAEHITRSKRHNPQRLHVHAHHVKAQMAVFLNCQVENPAFDSQTKEYLTTAVGDFGSTCPIARAAIVAVADTVGISDAVVESLQARERRQLATSTSARKTSRLVGVPKLEDALWAGTATRSAQCTLILTEGDSAKALAVAGLTVVGRERYGVFPLRGKMLNVRDASMRQIRGNLEVGYIVRIMGLDYARTYDNDADVATLRYGRIMLMADQDFDGAHINGLFINLIDTFWPALLRRTDFLQMFVTPIVKAFRARAPHELREFYAVSEYERWWSTVAADERRGWRIKYYKGLGTSTAAEGKAYFAALDRHCVPLVPSPSSSSPPSSPSIDRSLLDMAFNKSMAAQRKEWLSGYDPRTHIDYIHDGHLTYADFINKVFIHFSAYDNERSIPSLMDGLKPSQRKVLYACLTHSKLTTAADTKVAQLASFVAERTAYHHGEVSLQNTIVNMAQDFVGANNLPLLQPLGQFGTRHQGGKDSASPRYIYTKLHSWTRLVYPVADLPVLAYRHDDGKRVEPVFMAPIIPMILVNGADGVGTGWSTSCPQFNPSDIIANIRRKIAGTRMRPMQPWVRGFRGTVKPNGTGRFVTRGCVEVMGGGASVRITELPIRVWTEDYRMFLENLLDKVHTAGRRSYTVEQRHTDTTVEFVVRMSKAEVTAAASRTGGLEQYFRLENSISLSNMHLFDAARTMRRFTDPLEVIKSYYPVRAELYEKRRRHTISALQQQVDGVRTRHRFIEAVINGDVIIARQPKEAIVAALKAIGLPSSSSADGDDGGGDDGGSYDHLLGMPLSQLTAERAAALSRSVVEHQAALDECVRMTAADMWLADLAALEEAIQHN